MFHSNTYLFSNQSLQNSGGFVMKTSVQALPTLDLFVSNENDDEDASLLLTFETSADYEETVNNFVDRFAPGAPLPQVSLEILINNEDYSDYLVGQLNVTWGEDNSGTCSFTLKKVRPFTTIPVLSADSEIKDGSEVVIRSVTTLGTSEFTHTLFTGKINSFDYDMWEDTVQVECLDMSYDISRISKKISQEFYNIDPFFTEKLSPIDVSSVRLVYKLDKIIDTSSKETLLGIWHVTDTQLETNLLVDQARNAVLYKDENGSTYVFLIRNRLTGDLSDYVEAGTQLGRQFLFRYAISQEEQLKLEARPIKKSNLLKQIALKAGITDMRIIRENMPEDEIVNLAVTANNEFPLDFIRKVIVPQTWRAYFNEYGSLIIDREILNIQGQKLIADDKILEGTMRISQDVDGVINVQEVGGITVVQPIGGGNPNAPGISPPNKSGTICKEILLANIPITSGSQFTMNKAASQSNLDSALIFVQEEINTNTLDLQGGIVDINSVYFKLIVGNNTYTPSISTTRTTNLISLLTGTARPQIFTAPCYMLLRDKFDVLFIAAASELIRNQYDLSFSGLPTDAYVSPVCVKMMTGCQSCGAGVYKVDGFPRVIGVAVTILRPGTYVNSSSGIESVTINTLSGTLQVWGQLKLS